VIKQCQLPYILSAKKKRIYCVVEKTAAVQSRGENSLKSLKLKNIFFFQTKLIFSVSACMPFSPPRTLPLTYSLECIASKKNKTEGGGGGQNIEEEYKHPRSVKKVTIAKKFDSNVLSLQINLVWNEKLF
jgi:hypothetical protein